MFSDWSKVMQIESQLNVIESAELKKAVASEMNREDKSLKELIKESEDKAISNSGNTNCGKEEVKGDAPRNNNQ